MAAAKIHERDLTMVAHEISILVPTSTTITLFTISLGGAVAAPQRKFLSYSTKSSTTFATLRAPRRMDIFIYLMALIAFSC